MATSRQMRELLRSPAAMARFSATGELPRGVFPRGPLIDLLAKISLRDRLEIRGLTVDHRLGYQGSRIFANAQQAYLWVAPRGAGQEVFGSYPSESWRDKRRSEPLFIENLLDCATSVPEQMLGRYRALSDPVAARKAALQPTGTPGAEDEASDAAPKPNSPKLR